MIIKHNFISTGGTFPNYARFLKKRQYYKYTKMDKDLLKTDCTGKATGIDSAHINFENVRMSFRGGG